MAEYVATVYRVPGKIVVRINGTNYIYTRNEKGGVSVTTTNFKVDRTWTPIYSQVVTANLQSTAQKVMEMAANKLRKGWQRGN